MALTADQQHTEEQVQKMAGLVLNGGNTNAKGMPAAPPGQLATQARAAVPIVLQAPVRPSPFPDDLTDEEKAALEADGVTFVDGIPVLPSALPGPLPAAETTPTSLPTAVRGGVQQAVLGWGKGGALRVSRVYMNQQQTTWSLPAEAREPLCALLRAFGLTVVDLTGEDDDREEKQQ